MLLSQKEPPGIKIQAPSHHHCPKIVPFRYLLLIASQIISTQSLILIGSYHENVIVFCQPILS